MALSRYSGICVLGHTKDFAVSRISGIAVVY
jgi:hypothetical protein